MTVKKIKSLSNDDLIITLCLAMYSDTKVSFDNQRKVLQELHNRKIISSVGYVIDKIA